MVQLTGSSAFRAPTARLCSLGTLRALMHRLQMRSSHSTVEVRTVFALDLPEYTDAASGFSSPRKPDVRSWTLVNQKAGSGFSM